MEAVFESDICTGRWILQSKCHIFTTIHGKRTKQLYSFLVLCSRNCVCNGKLSIHFLAMYELWRKSSVGTACVLLSICYHFSIWLGICTDLTSVYDTWPYPKWTWTHRADCHQVRFRVSVFHQVPLISICMLAAWMVAIHNAVTSNLTQISSICVINLTFKWPLSTYMNTHKKNAAGNWFYIFRQQGNYCTF